MEVSNFQSVSSTEWNSLHTHTNCKNDMTHREREGAVVYRPSWKRYIFCAATLMRRLVTELSVHCEFRAKHLCIMPCRISDWHVCLCIYVCKKIFCSHRKKQPYILDCHGGTTEMYHCALENMTDLSFARNWVSDSDGSRTVSAWKWTPSSRPRGSKTSLSVSLSPAVRDDEVAVHSWT